MHAATPEETAVLEKINAVLGRINAKTAQLHAAIDDKIGYLPTVLRERVLAGWREFTALLYQCWDALEDIVSHMGSPSTLWATADAWSATVGGPISGQVHTAEASLLAVDDTWQGTAATAYQQQLPLQKTALTAVKTTLSDPVSTALSDLAKAIMTFWGGLVIALCALAGGIIAALSSSATIIGLPAAPLIAAAAALTAVGSCLSGGLILRSTAAGVNTTLQQKLHDDTPYSDGGHWPRATT